MWLYVSRRALHAAVHEWCKPDGLVLRLRAFDTHAIQPNNVGFLLLASIERVCDEA
jgi:hypothetical protein